MPNKKRQHLKPEWGYDKELKAILNDTQYADYEKIKLHQIMALMHTKRLVYLLGTKVVAVNIQAQRTGTI